MATQHPNQKPSLYPQIDLSNPDSSSPFSRNPNRNSSSLYPSIEVDDLAENLFPDEYNRYGGGRGVDSELGSPSAPPEPEPVTVEEVLISIPGAILHLIDRQYSVELACGDFSVLSLRQGGNVVAILARVADEVQWPLVKDEAVVKVDDSHYFFSFGNVKEMGSDSSEEGKKKEKKKDKKVKKENAGSEDLLNYGLSFALKGQENLMKELDKILETYSGFSVQKVKRKEGVLDVAATEFSPEDLKNAGKREAMERKCGAYWTTLAPNVEEYSGTAARLIASGSRQLIKGILWCGDVTADRLKWGSEVMKKRLNSSEKKEVDKKTLKRIKRVKRMTKMTEKVATGVLSGVVKVSGLFTSSVVNSKAGKKFFGLLPGEIILASLDGFNRICDAVEVAGKNAMSTSSNVTTELVTHRYGEDAGNATHQGLDAAGHAIGTAWTVFKIRKALNPKSSLKPTSIAKSAVKAAAAEYKTKKNSK